MANTNYIYCKLWAEGRIQEALEFKKSGILPTAPSDWDDEAIISNSPSATEFSLPNWPADLPLVGHGYAKTTCGMPYFVGCLEFHDSMELPIGVEHQHDLRGQCLSNGVWVKVKRMWCHRPSCPVCFKHWIDREIARSMKRFEAHNKKYGSAGKELHHVVSVPIQFYGLSLKKMRFLRLTAAKLVGLKGASCVYHSKRWKHGKAYFSAHFHFIGYSEDINGDKVAEVFNYGWVHDAKGKACLQSEFHPGKQLKVQKNHGFFQKNVGLRNSLAGTIGYELSHAAVPPNSGHVSNLVWRAGI